MIQRATPLPVSVVEHNYFESHPLTEDAGYFFRFKEATDVTKLKIKRQSDMKYHLKIVFITTEEVVTVSWFKNNNFTLPPFGLLKSEDQWKVGVQWNV